MGSCVACVVKDTPCMYGWYVGYVAPYILLDFGVSAFSLAAWIVYMNFGFLVHANTSYFKMLTLTLMYELQCTAQFTSRYRIQVFDLETCMSDVINEFKFDVFSKAPRLQLPSIVGPMVRIVICDSAFSKPVSVLGHVLRKCLGRTCVPPVRKSSCNSIAQFKWGHLKHALWSTPEMPYRRYWNKKSLFQKSLLVCFAPYK